MSKLWSRKLENQVVSIFAVTSSTSWSPSPYCSHSIVSPQRQISGTEKKNQHYGHYGTTRPNIIAWQFQLKAGHNRCSFLFIKHDTCFHVTKSCMQKSKCKPHAVCKRWTKSPWQHSLVSEEVLRSLKLSIFSVVVLRFWTQTWWARKHGMMTG